MRGLVFVCFPDVGLSVVVLLVSDSTSSTSSNKVLGSVEASI